MNKKGFTLVELLLVRVIMGIITALTMPSFIESITESKLQKERHLEFLIKQQLDLLNKDVGEYDFWYEGDTEIDLLDSEYREKIENDIDLDGCNITKLVIKKAGSHEVGLNCTNAE